MTEAYDQYRAMSPDERGPSAQEIIRQAVAGTPCADIEPRTIRTDQGLIDAAGVQHLFNRILDQRLKPVYFRLEALENTRYPYAHEASRPEDV